MVEGPEGTRCRERGRRASGKKLGRLEVRRREATGDTERLRRAKRARNTAGEGKNQDKGSATEAIITARAVIEERVVARETRSWRRSGREGGAEALEAMSGN